MDNSTTNKIKKPNSEKLIKRCSKIKKEPISKIEINVRKEMPWTMQNI